MKKALPLLALLVINTTPAEAGVLAVAKRVVKLPVYIAEATKDAALGFVIEIVTYMVFAP